MIIGIDENYIDIYRAINIYRYTMKKSGPIELLNVFICSIKTADVDGADRLHLIKLYQGIICISYVHIMSMIIFHLSPNCKKG